MFKLRFNDYQHKPVWVVDKGFTIGSAQGNSLVINDDSVSPQHARLIETSPKIILKSLSNTNGTFVNGDPITEKTLNIGDIVRFGQISATVIDPTEEDSHYQWALIGNAKLLAGKEFPLLLGEGSEKTDIIVGRGKKCDIAFPGTHLSKEHAKFSLQDGQLYVEDLNSSNGVFVNDERVQQAAIYPGDSIRLDVHRFVLFGPHRHSKSMDDRSPIDQGINDPDNSNQDASYQNPNPPKQWITRPTSPGNRPEKKAHNETHLTVYFLSALLVILLVSLSLYTLM